MSFDLDKLQAVAELGEVIRLHNDAIERLAAFRKARPQMMMPNLAKMVEENLKENVQVLYKELNNLHKPAEQQTRYICDDCHMAFLVKLPGGICDECRARRASKPRDYTVHSTPYDMNAEDEVETSEPSTHGDSVAEELTLADQVAEEVADDLNVADKMPRTDVDGEPVENRAQSRVDDGYQISMEDAGDFSFEDLLAEDAGEEIASSRESDSVPVDDAGKDDDKAPLSPDDNDTETDDRA